MKKALSIKEIAQSFFILGVLFFIFPTGVYAADLWNTFGEATTTSPECGGTTGCFIHITDQLEYDQFLFSITVEDLFLTTGSPADVTVAVREYASNPYPETGVGFTYRGIFGTTTISTTEGVAIINASSSPIELNAGNWYGFYITGGSGHISWDAYFDPNGKIIPDVSNGYRAASKGTGFSLTGVNSAITALNSPTRPTIDGTHTNISFDFDYVSGTPTPAFACIYLTNHTLSQSLVPVCETVTQNGNLNYSQTVTLQDDSYYLWRAVLLDADNNVIATSPNAVYDTGSGNQNIAPTPSFGGFSSSTLASTTESAGIFGNVLNNAFGFLQSLPPWSYYFQIRTELEAQVTSLNGASEELPETTITFLGNTALSFDVVMFDSEAITDLTGEGIWTTIRLLIASLLWILIGFVASGSIRSRIR